MFRSTLSRVLSIAVFTLIAALGPSKPVFADFSLVLPAGIGCEFELGIDSVGGNQVYNEYYDKNGNLVRSLSAGKGALLTFTNTGTNTSLTYKTGGSVTHTTYNPDGTQTVSGTGHNAFVFFPTDVPAGPATILYIGRILYTVDANLVYTLVEAKGKSIDICAELS